jgi:hypothetical protein
MFAVLVAYALSEERARSLGETLLSGARVAEVLLRLEAAGGFVLLRRERGSGVVEVRFAGGAREAALGALRADRVVVMREDSPRMLADLAHASPPDGVVAESAAVPSGVRGVAARALCAFGRLVCGVDPAVLAASWCVLPRRIVAAAQEAGLGPGLIPYVIARIAPCAGVPVVARPAVPGVTCATARELALALCRGVGYAFMPARARPFARWTLVLALSLALGGLVQKAGATSRGMFATIAAKGFGATHWGIPADELCRQLPPTGKVFAIVEPRPARFRTNWYLQNCLCPRIVVCGEESFARDPSIAYVVMKFGDPAREAQFCATHGVRITARCANGFAVGRRGQ